LFKYSWVDTAIMFENQYKNGKIEAKSEHSCHILRHTGGLVSLRLSTSLVEACIRFAPYKVVLYGRDPKHDVVLEDNSV